ncbi:MAG TPA: thioredoxin domain-containing protein [Acidobacteriaceae bacterium]
MKKYVIAVCVMVAIAAAGLYYYRSQTPPAGDTTTADSSQQAAIPALPQPTPDRNAPNEGFPFQDTSMLKPPAGAKVAIFEFEDLECPACAHAAPVVHAAAARYKVPLERHDYPWTFHVWSFDAAVTARYLQDKVSPQLADEFRRDVFVNQPRIVNKDDLTRFTRAWFQSHGQTMPFVIDPDGTCRNEVEADRAMGDRLGVKSTPCILVVTQSNWVAVASPDQLDNILEDAIAKTGGQVPGV